MLEGAGGSKRIVGHRTGQFRIKHSQHGQNPCVGIPEYVAVVFVGSQPHRSYTEPRAFAYGAVEIVKSRACHALKSLVAVDLHIRPPQVGPLLFVAPDQLTVTLSDGIDHLPVGFIVGIRKIGRRNRGSYGPHACTLPLFQTYRNGIRAYAPPEAIGHERGSRGHHVADSVVGGRRTTDLYPAVLAPYSGPRRHRTRKIGREVGMNRHRDFGIADRAEIHLGHNGMGHLPEGPVSDAYIHIAQTVGGDDRGPAHVEFLPPFLHARPRIVHSHVDANGRYDSAYGAHLAYPSVVEHRGLKHFPGMRPCGIHHYARVAVAEHRRKIISRIGHRHLPSVGCAGDNKPVENHEQKDP